MNTLRYCCIALLACLAANAFSGADERGDIGTTIVGDSEVSMGLYLMPWRDSPVVDIDRPPRRIHEGLQAVDPDAFKARSDWRQEFGAYRRFKVQPKY